MSTIDLDSTAVENVSKILHMDIYEESQDADPVMGKGYSEMVVIYDREGGNVISTDDPLWIDFALSGQVLSADTYGCIAYKVEDVIAYLKGNLQELPRYECRVMVAIDAETGNEHIEVAAWPVVQGE